MVCLHGGMNDPLLIALLLVPVFTFVGMWFGAQGRSTVAFKVMKLLHIAYLLVLGLTLVSLSVSTSAQANYEHWVQWFLTNMLVQLYLFTALPFMAGFAWSSRGAPSIRP